MRKKCFSDKVTLIKDLLLLLTPLAVGAVLVMGIITVNLIVNTSPQAINMKRAQEKAIMSKQADRDRAEFDRLRRKHGLAATAVVIYEPEQTPYYYGIRNEKIALK